MFDAKVSDCLTGAVLFGVDFHANDANYSFYVNAGHNYDVGKNVYGSGWGPGDDWGWHNAPFLPERQIVELSPGKFKLGDTGYKTYPYVDFASPDLTMYLFAINFFGGEINTFVNQHIRFFSCQIYEGTTLVRNFVPAKKNGFFGVYDKKKDKFYEMQGSGTVSAYKEAVIPSAQNWTYNGTRNTGVYVGLGYTLTGNTGTKAGKYEAIAKLSDGYCWSDGTLDEEKTIIWSIAKQKVKAPETFRLHYNGREILEPPYNDLYSVELEKKTDVGEGYKATFKLKDADNYCWENTDSAEIVITYDIHEYEDDGGICKICGMSNTITMGTDAIAKNDNIYYGNQSKWRVISKNGNTTNTADFQEIADATFTNDDGQTVAKENALFVISENYHKNMIFNSNGNQNWQGSVAQAWCNDDLYTETGISAKEKAAILTTKKSDAEYNKSEPLYLYKYMSSDEILNDKVFYLSAKEADTFFDGNADRRLRNGVWWWLRSPYNNKVSYFNGTINVYYDGMMESDGSFNSAAVNNDTVAPRPAFNLNSESVLFASVVGIQSEGSGNEWELTLLDEYRAFETGSVKRNINTLILAYTGARVGDNEKISYIITDKDQKQIKYHGSQPVEAESGSVYIMLPEMACDDKMFVFNEQDNGAKRTNYASELKEVTVPAPEYLKWDNIANKMVLDSVIDFTLMTDKIQYLNSGWYVVGGNIELKNRPVVNGDVHIVLMDNATLTANHGITVEEGNTLRIYAQSDEESKMGKLIAETKGVTAIGGRNGENAAAAQAWFTIRRGGDGGTGGNVYFYGGKISLKSEDIATVGGGHGGCGSIYYGSDGQSQIILYHGGDGGNGGSSGKVYFYGGNVLLQNNNAACIGGGNGGNGGYFILENGSHYRNGDGSVGSSGSLTDGFWNVYGSTVIKVGDNADNAGIIDKNDGYNGQKYLSVQYHKWDNYSLTTHKCDICGEEEEHNDDGNGICTICGNKIIEIIGKEAATCEKSGHLAYYPFNENYYSDQDYTAQITDLTKWLNTNVEDGGGMIPVIGHTWEHGTGENYPYHICEVCGRKEMHTYGYGNRCTVCGTLNIVHMGSSVISVNDNICYGDQKKWRVLSKNGNTTDSDGSTAGFSDGTNQVSKDNALFVISENDFGYRQFNSNDNQNWQLSDAQKWCNEGGFYTDAGITTAEQNAILTTSKSDAAYSDFKAADNILNDKVFYLSANETATYFNNAADRQLKPDGSNESVRWWLRSPSCVDDVRVGMVSTLGNILNDYYANSMGVSRPAFNLNSEYILFTSAADFTSEGIGNEWKLTLLDEKRAFAIDNVTRSGKTLTVAYTGAKTGTNERISYVITDREQKVIKYYVSQAVTDADGIVDITLPPMAAGDRLFVFNEQDNGAKKTNYASALQEIEVSMIDSLTLNITENTFTVTPSGEDAGNGVVFVGLFDKERSGRLLDVKKFDLKTQTPTGTFDAEGYVKAMWWNDMMPFCEAVGK